MQHGTCASFLKEAPGLAHLLLYLEQQVLKRHCRDGDSYQSIAATFAMTPKEVQTVHDRAIERLDGALLHLLADLQATGLGADVRQLLQETFDPADSPRRLSPAA
jgi:hypothetical protein